MSQARPNLFLLLSLIFAGAILVAPPCVAKAQSSPESITLQLDWHPSAQFAGVLVASQKGFYRRQGLAVKLVEADTEMAPFELIANSNDTIGVSEAESLVLERGKGFRIQAFATMMQTSPFSILTLKESGLTTISGLKGKRIGLYGDGRQAIEQLLHFNHMTTNDVTMVDIPFSLEPLIQGKVDAMQGYSIDEAVRLNLQHHPVNIIPMSQNGYVSYAEVLFTSERMIRERPDTLVRFLRATRRGWLYAIAHQEETAKMIVEKYLPKGSLEEQRQSLAQTIPLLNAETHDTRFGEMNKETWRQSIAMFKRFQGSNSDARADELVNYSILQTLYPK